MEDRVVQVTCLSNLPQLVRLKSSHVSDIAYSKADNFILIELLSKQILTQEFIFDPPTLWNKGWASRFIELIDELFSITL